MSPDRFGTIINAPSHPRRTVPAYLFERAPRPRSFDWSYEELNPLTTVLLAASAFRVPGHCGEKGRMSFDGQFSDALLAAFPDGTVEEARDTFTWGRAPGLQHFVVAQAYKHCNPETVLDTVTAIADISRTERITKKKLQDYTSLHDVKEQRDYVALSTPLRDLSLLAISSCTD